MPDNVIGDPLRLQQIITNLVGNAIKFTKNGNIDILVEKRALSNTKVQIEVQIRDTGIGIPERDQSRLFQAFRQADASISRRHGGTGLGLVITKNWLMKSAAIFRSIASRIAVQLSGSTLISI
ncbi:ATP-binding protein [Escherichia coli]